MEFLKDILKIGLLAILITLIIKLFMYLVIAVLLDFIFFLFGITFSYRVFWAIVIIMEALRALFRKRDTK